MAHRAALLRLRACSPLQAAEASRLPRPALLLPPLRALPLPPSTIARSATPQVAMVPLPLVATKKMTLVQ